MGNFPKLSEGTELQVGSHKATIIKYLSEGGFAHIYQVKIYPEEDGSPIACLKRVIVRDKAGLNQLRNEVEVMKKLSNCKNVVRYYDSHASRLEDGSYQVLVVMELCPNKSLLDFMNAKIHTKLSEAEIVKIMFDISIGISEMHKLKLIHRDIKIENVLIDAHQNFKLCDFGSTSAILRPPRNQQELQLLQNDITNQTTPQYRAPEMIDLYRGFPIDEKSDIWALGVFLYKLCYYTTPFEGSGELAILHASYQFPQLPEYSSDLKNIIIILLQENPIFRPNIIQVIMILKKMLNLNDYVVDDFFEMGEYDFKKLHEYQLRKHQETVSQQMYYQQQQQQEQHHQQQHLQNQVLNNQHATLEVPSDHENHIYTQHYSHSQADIASQQDSDYLTVSLNRSSEKLAIDSEDDLADLDNAEERFPSVEMLSHSKSPTPHAEFQENSAPSLGSNGPPLTTSQIQQLTPSQLQQYQYHYQQQQQPNPNFDASDAASPSAKQSKIIPKSPELLKKEAWERHMEGETEIPGETKKLADDIFGSVKKTREKSAEPKEISSGPIASRVDANTVNDINVDPNFGSELKKVLSSHQKEYILEPIDSQPYEKDSLPSQNAFGEYDDSTNVVPDELSVKPLPIRSDENSYSINDLQQIDSNGSPNRPRPIQHTSQGIKTLKPFPLINTQSTKGKFKQSSKSTPVKEQISGNPWGEYTSTKSDSLSNSKSLAGIPYIDFGKPDLSVVKDNPDIQVVPAARQSRSFLSNQFNNLKLQENYSNFSPLGSLDNDVVPYPIHEPSLIDLNLNYESQSPIAPSLPMRPMRPKLSDSASPRSLPQEISFLDNDKSLLDLNLDQEASRRKLAAGALNLKEEVIDFSSDDENPQNDKRMNRLSIRKSVTRNRSKSRKSSDNRSDASAAESKKRMSFFGGREQ